MTDDELTPLLATGQSDDLRIALDAAAVIMSRRATQCCDGDALVAARTTVMADMFVEWLRRLGSITLDLVSVVDGDTGQRQPIRKEHGMTLIADTDVATYVIDAKDRRGFDVDASLAASATLASGNPVPDGAVVLNEATSGTASGKDELVVDARLLAPGDSLLVRVESPADPTIFGSDSLDVSTGAVATVTLEAPTIVTPPAEPVPAPAPEPAPEPTP